ncbi:39S ribosomal protein L46, mitochondrial [Trypanosoma conorhini]|uniref:39S ribosomal protein L46, mitochondrial n=1 Tax=Trypanosoma conorhini TaxID=83891 RepID=A0A3R7NI70_9TRYP|nr:39S ribosomal protein L46, mitochondrial [Trypanosoma conorhini]RNF18876.1 39S ribosomal protein L46, mitochondrial [Trypanosoma conorhini]
MRLVALPPRLAGRSFHAQHRTPIIPQLPLGDTSPESTTGVLVGYLLHRHPVVKHTPHPLEAEMGFLLEREHQRYCRHEASESATHFMGQRGLSIDVMNRTDPQETKSNFFGLDLYQDAMRVVLQRYTPEKRVTPHDLWNPAELGDGGPPPRHSIHRKLDDYLYLIVKEAASGKWTVPQTAVKPRETLRMGVDRAIAKHNSDALDCYVWSNAPQATVLNTVENTRLFVYAATYLMGRPKFSEFEPVLEDHAWVTRHEMLQYKQEFQSTDLLEALLDISADGTFESV